MAKTVNLEKVNNTGYDLTNELLTFVSKDTKTFKFDVGSSGPTGLTNSSGGDVFNPLDSGETAGDIEWAHVVAPAAKIVLLEMTGNFNLFDEAIAANAAANVVKASIVSMSFGGNEYSGENINSAILNDSDFSHVGVTYITGSGDHGTPDGYPENSPNVLAVGATNLAINNDGSYHNEAGWSNITNITSISVNGNVVTITTQNATGLVPGADALITGVSDNNYNGDFTVISTTDGTKKFTFEDDNGPLGPASGGTVGDLPGNNGGGSGGGFSQFEEQPAYQNGKVANANTDDGSGDNTTTRLTPDVSWLGGEPTSVVAYDSNNLDSSNNVQPNVSFDGTSLAGPMWAGLVAIIDQGRKTVGLGSLSTSDPTGGLQALLYSLPASDFNDITEGFNGFNAGPGYDLVTGLGTPIPNLIVNDLVSGGTPLGHRRSPFS